jgi:hypothetical protein
MLAAAAGGVLVPQAAGAATAHRGASPNAGAATTGCPSSTFCLWSDVTFGGTRFDYSYSGHRHNTWLYVGSNANDRAASLQNNRGWTTKVSQSYPESGGYFCWQGNTGSSDLLNRPYVNSTALQYHTISSYDLKTSTVRSCTAGA